MTNHHANNREKERERESFFGEEKRRKKRRKRERERGRGRRFRREKEGKTLARSLARSLACFVLRSFSRHYYSSPLWNDVSKRRGSEAPKSSSQKRNLSREYSLEVFRGRIFSLRGRKEKKFCRSPSSSSSPLLTQKKKKLHLEERRTPPRVASAPLSLRCSFSLSRARIREVLLSSIDRLSPIQGRDRETPDAEEALSG